MIKGILAGSVLAVALLVVRHPAKANWLCGPEQCVWVHHGYLSAPHGPQLILETWHFRSLENDLSLG